jgi:hypothetical protein
MSFVLRFEVLACRAKSDSGQTPGNREDYLINPRLVEQSKGDVKTIALVLWAVRIRADCNSNSPRFGFAYQPRVGLEISFPAFLEGLAVNKPRVDFDR